MNNRSQLIGQVFLFILAGLVFVLILMYGYSAITKLIETKRNIDLIEFKTSLEQSITGIRTSTGSVRKATFSLPSEYKEFCAVDPFMTAIHSQEFKKKHPLFFNIWKSDSSITIYVTPLLETPLNLPDITVKGPLHDEPGFLCLPISNGKFSLKLQGTGTTAQISTWEP